MEWLYKFLDRHMEKSVLVTFGTAIIQLTNNMMLPADMTDETLRHLIASSSGLQAFMLMVLYIFLKYQKEKKK